MEMKQISETTLKISISMEDLADRGMELKDFLIPQEKTEEFFYSMMDELELPDNFKNGGMLSFRVTPRKDRLDVFVTKSDIDKDLNFDDLADLGDISQMSPDEFFKTLEQSMKAKGDTEAHEKLEKLEEMMEKAVDDTLQETSEALANGDASILEDDQDSTSDNPYVHYVFEFKDLREAITFSKAVKVIPEASELFKGTDGYYMTVLIGVENQPAYYANMMYARMLEHANQSKKTRAYLQEHGVQLIVDGALERLRTIKG